jgi:hypothetical protein
MLFQLLIPGLNPVSLLDSELGFEIATQLANTERRKTTIFKCTVHGTNYSAALRKRQVCNAKLAIFSVNIAARSFPSYCPPS